MEPDTCGWCTKPLPPDGHSLYFCDENCQHHWLVAHALALPDPTTRRPAFAPNRLDPASRKAA